MKKYFHGWWQNIKSLFLKGLFAILPLAATITVVKLTYSVARNWLAPLRALEPTLLQKIPGSEFVLIFLLLIAVGLLVQYLIIDPFIDYLEKVILRIPLVRMVYSGIKTVVDFLNVPRHPEFKRKVVLIAYPQQHTYSLAFLTGTAQESFEPLIPLSQRGDKRYVKVFMPTTHLTVGYFFIIPEDEVIYTDISFEEAIKSIVSCGLINPPQRTPPTSKHD